MKVKLIIILLGFLLCLTSCFPSVKDEADTVSSEKSDVLDIDRIENMNSIPKHIKKTIYENLQVDANVYGSGENFDILNAKLKKYNVDTISSLLIPNEIVTEKKELKNGGFSIKTNKESSLRVSTTRFNFRKEQYNGYDMLFSDISKSMEQSFPLSELSSVSINDSIKMVKETIQSFGGDVVNEPKVYALDEESLNKRSVDIRKYMEDGFAGKKIEIKQSFTKADEAYLILFECQKNSIPFFSEDFRLSGQSTPTEGSKVHALVNKDGFIMFDVVGIYDTESVIQKNSSVITPERALESLKEKYRNIILTDKTLITNISLRYLPEKEKDSDDRYTLIPVWSLTVETTRHISDAKGEKDVTDESVIAINAITGKEIM